MDHINRFESRTTLLLLRAEYGVALVVGVVLLLIHIGEIRWIPAVALFAYIDVIGYIPGAIAYRRSPDKKISKVYYVLYNTMHSLVTQAVVVGLWIWLFGFEWALLMVPVHLCGDRAIFGNFLKSFRVPFEPEATTGFAEFDKTITRAPQRPQQPQPERI
ncbi:hypothetical protein [Kutzneria sp. NPDC051319]|uniref:hypothetical protein n=1 Tax=Kutzneria sp. NPDC051319 TaxID=3155047 RepID=UPI00341F890C